VSTSNLVIHIVLIVSSHYLLIFVISHLIYVKKLYLIFSMNFSIFQSDDVFFSTEELSKYLDRRSNCKSGTQLDRNVFEQSRVVITEVLRVL